MVWYSPFIAAFLVDDRAVVVFQIGDEGFPCLIFEFEAIDEKERALGVAGAQEELDDGRGGERLAGAGGHLEQETTVPFGDGILNRRHGALLVVAQEAQFVLLDEFVAFGEGVPAGFGGVAGALREGDVVAADRLDDQPLRVGLEGVVALERVGRRIAGDEVRVALLQIPEVVQVAIGKDDEAAFLRLGVLARLLLADQRILVFGLGFEHKQRFAVFVEQQEVDEAVAGLLEVFAEFVDGVLRQLDIGFERDVRRAGVVGEKTPAGVFQQSVDLDASPGFFRRHEGQPSRVMFGSGRGNEPRQFTSSASRAACNRGFRGAGDRAPINRPIFGRNAESRVLIAFAAGSLRKGNDHAPFRRGRRSVRGPMRAAVVTWRTRVIRAGIPEPVRAPDAGGS